MAYWKHIRGLTDPISIRQFKGVYKPDDDGFNLAEGFAQDLRNISSQSFPALSLRPPFSLLGNNLSGRVTGLGTWKNGELHAIANGTWSRWNGSSWSPITGGSGFSNTADVSFANFKGNLSGVNLIATNGIDPPKRYDGSTVQTLTGAPSGGNYVEQHDNRCYMAVDNTIHFSALSKPTDWSTAKDAGQINLETNNGQKIIGMRGGNQHLTVFKESSIHELFGTGPSNYKLIEVANDIGAYSNKAIVNAAGTLFFVSNRIYQYSGGSRPDYSFSKPVQKYIDRINQSVKGNCVAGTNGKNVYFAIPYEDSLECNIILEYDMQYGVWYVWDNIQATHFARIANNWYMGDSGGNVFQMDSGTGDNGVATSWKWVSPPYGASTLAKRTNWYNMWIVVDLPYGSTLNVSLSKQTSGDSDWVAVKSFAPQTSVQSGRIIIPLASVAMSNFIRVKFEGTGPFRIFEFDRQMREMPIK